MDFQEVGGGRGDWMELAQDRDRWRALVGTMTELDAAINYRFIVCENPALIFGFMGCFLFYLLEGSESFLRS